MMKFDPKRIAFGRHETFALRFSWLPKGFRALEQDRDIFVSDDATVELGVGKNMVAAIRYWLRASQIIDPITSAPTEVGSLVFGKEGLDPYLEDEATIWLIHWLIASNSELATAWYWFFNKYHKPEFTSQELSTALIDFVKDVVTEGKKPSVSTLKNDAQLLHRMYTQSKGNGRKPIEEALDSPLALLRIMTQSAGGRRFTSRPEARPGLPIGVLGYAVVQLMNECNLKTIPIEDLMYARADTSVPGAVFRLTENDLIKKLELLVDYIPGYMLINETSGIHQIALVSDELIDPLTYLKQHYNQFKSVVAA